jgi:PAS domain S-box-containing protein
MDATKPDRISIRPHPLRVLILEDNRRDAKLMARVLEGGGFGVQFEVTDSPEIFRESLEKVEYDVILSDFNLRNWTAFDALEILKRSGNDVPLIVVTGSMGDEAAVECIKQGATDFVLKDRPARLPTAVRRALEEKHLRTENKRAFEAISRLATIVESSDDAIIGTTLEGVIATWNKGAEKLYGYSAAEVLGRPISILIPPDQSAEVTQMLARHRHGALIEHFETVRVRKDGRRIDVSLEVFPLRDTSGQITGTASITRDITERKEVEITLRESEAHFRSLFENMLNGYAYCKMHFEQGQPADFTYLNVNRAFETLTGLKGVVNRRVSDVIPGMRESNPELFEIYGRVASTGIPERFETLVNALGMWFSISVYSPRKEYFVAVFDVIAERKRAEEALQNERAFTDSIIDSLPDSFFIVDSTGRYVRWNKNAGKALGYGSEEFAAMNPLDHVPDDERPVAASKMQEALAKGRATAEVHLLTKEGRKIPYILTATRALIGDKVYLVGMGLDITERKRTEEALRESERKYRQLHESMIDGFVRVDLDGRIRETNDAYCKMLGYTPEELSRLTYQDLTPEKWHAFEAEITAEQVLARGYSEVYLKEYRRKSGAIIPVELRSYLMLDESGNACGMWAIVRDMTERRWAEEMLQEYEKVVEGSDEMIAVVDRGYCYLLANRAFLEQRGLERKDVVGSSVAEVLGEEFFERVVKEKLDECFRGNVVRYEVRYQYPKGGRDLLVSYFPIEGYHGVDRAACVMQDITERKQAEARLKESEEKFRKAFMTGADAFYIATLNEGLIIEVNDCFQEVFGYRCEEVIGKTSIQLGLCADPVDRARLVSEVKSKGYVRNMEIRARRKGGEIFPLLISVNLLQESGEQLILGVIRDITERKRAEEALRESEERFRLFMSNSPTVAWIKDQQGYYVYISETYQKQLGVRVEDRWGKTDFDVYPRAIAEQFRKNDQAALAAGHSIEVTEESLGPGGEQRYWFAYKFPFQDASGQVFVAGIGVDITERKRAEGEHIRLVTAIEQSAEAVVITNTNGDIEYVNPAFTRITGYSREEVLGHNPRILKSGKHDPEFYRQLWANILKGEIWHGEIINQRKDGKLYTEEMNIAPVRGARGEVTHFIATKQDVTERKALEEQLRQAGKIEAIGRLAGGVAHDFNNLLTIINGYTDLLEEKLAPDNRASAHLKEIKDAGERAASLTRQLLAFSRRQVLTSKVLDLNAVISDLEKMLKRLIGEDIALRTILDRPLGRVKADPGQIEQVLMNLAVNARDAMPLGGDLTIETSNVELDETFARSHITVKPGPHVMLAVRDTGVGMTPETKARIFEPFFTTKENGKGTGLGLASVYGIVKQSGGSIWVDSELGQGTVFKVYLPSVSESPAAKVHAKTETDSASGSETILVVEDEEGVRSLVCMALGSAGYKVLETEDGESALAICANYDGPIHLLLADVVMPKMSGPMVAEKVTALRPNIKVLYMSGYTNDAIVHHGVLSHDMPFIQKPFSPGVLRKKIREVLGGK